MPRHRTVPDSGGMADHTLPAPFPRYPTCEECEKDLATSFSLVAERWKFTCECTSEAETYYIKLDDFFRRPAAMVDWLGHMHEKGWMNWNDFMDMMLRFRAATGSYNQ